MLTLAIESSTVQCSAALMRNDSVLAESAWQDSAAEHQRLFRILPDLFREAGVAAADVARYAVDVGPGRFSGLRVALATANAMAQPGRCPVLGVSAGEAIAFDLLRRSDTRPVVVVGDARRERLWLVRLAGPSLSGTVPAYESVPVDRLAWRLLSGDRILTPDWPKLEAPIEAACRATGAEPIRTPAYPSAASIARIAQLKADAGSVALSTPPAIIYLHPAVAVTP